jgi:hypothetical protein
MAAKDRFPLFLSDHAEDPVQLDTGTSWNRAVISTRILKASVFGIAATAIVFAVVAVENPQLLFEDAEFLASTRAFLVQLSRPQQDTSETTPVTPSANVAEALPPAAPEAPAGGEIAAPFKTADRSETETRPPPTESLLGQFQAWAAGENARTEVPPAQPVQDAPAQPVQDAQPQPVQDVQPQPVQDAQTNPGANPGQDTRANPVTDARTEIRPAQKRRPVRQVRNAPPEIRLEQSLRAKDRREQNARARLRPAQIRPARDARAQDIRAQEPPVQNARPPTLLESLGFRDPGSRE